MPKFADIVGQKQIKEYLKTAITTGKISHAYIISAERSAGKEFLARTFAQALQCEQGGTEPCGVCHSCRQAESRNHPDIIYINRVKASSIGVDEVREQLCNDVNIRPYSRPYKIYIINEAERLTVQAQNAILKTLEEPPEYVVIMLLTANVSSFLPTVRSRCVELEMKPVSNEEIKKFLMEEMEIPDYRADVCVAFAQGNVGKAREMAKSDDFNAIQNVAINLVKNARETEVSDMIELIQSMTEYKVDPQEYLDIITVWYRDILLFKATGDTDNIVYHDQLPTIRKVAGRCSYEGIETVLEAIRKAKSRLNANVNFELTMELLMNTIQELG
jgi:DNA polymerase-3 subunit delta'